MKHSGLEGSDRAAELAWRRSLSLTSGPSRRELLKALAAAAAGAALPASGLLAQTASRVARGKARRIDVHHHITIPNWSKASRVGATWNWSPAVLIEQMDKYAAGD